MEKRKSTSVLSVKIKRKMEHADSRSRYSDTGDMLRRVSGSIRDDMDNLSPIDFYVPPSLHFNSKDEFDNDAEFMDTSGADDSTLSS
jgi:hypothetical protein